MSDMLAMCAFGVPRAGTAGAPLAPKEAIVTNFLWGLWKGISAWPVLLVHAFGGWQKFPVYNLIRDGGWYQLGFLLGAGSPFFGLFGRSRRKCRKDEIG